MDFFSRLPEGCVSDILSLTSPRDVCRSSAISKGFKSVADSDAVWDRFLPSDRAEIMLRSVPPLPFSSKKQLYFRLKLDSKEKIAEWNEALREALEKITERAGGTEALKEHFLQERRAKRKEKRDLLFESLIQEAEHGENLDISEDLEAALIHEAHLDSSTLFEVSLPSKDLPQAEKIDRQGSERSGYSEPSFWVFFVVLYDLFPTLGYIFILLQFPSIEMHDVM